MSQREQKLSLLAEACRFDVSAPGEGMQALAGAYSINYRRQGGCGKLLKVLMHGTCSHNCAYCAICLRRERIGFAPEELAQAFLRLYREGRAGGLFLSSGIPHDVDRVTADILETGELLRKMGYEGYLHLKVLPGAARTDIRELARVADRISINLEAPSSDRLGDLTGVKDYTNDILKRQSWVADAKPGGHTTQLVIGAAEETDAEIARCVTGQYRTARPSRIYYSAFRALPGTPLAGKSDTPAWRARRWYQIDYLLREYRIPAGDVYAVLDEQGYLKDQDPKEILFAGQGNVNVNTASLQDLLRVPGIGPQGADRILAMRRDRPFADIRDLRRAGIRTTRVRPFVTFGRREAVQMQLDL
jgi:predicted DNA-binding helix-hairpin-helix protein